MLSLKIPDCYSQSTVLIIVNKLYLHTRISYHAINTIEVPKLHTTIMQNTAIQIPMPQIL